MKNMLSRAFAGYRSLAPAASDESISGDMEESVLTRQLILLAVSIITGFVLISYWNIPITSYAWRGYDEWCDWTIEGIGFHCFGDFHQFVRVSDGDPQLVLPDGNSLVNSSQGRSPLGAVISDLFTLLMKWIHPRIVLVCWVLVSIFSVIWPLLVASGRRPLQRRIQIVLLFGVLTMPFWAVVDRGQQLALAVPGMFMFAVGWLRSQHRQVAISGAYLILLKPQFALLAIPMIALRNWPQIRLFMVLTVGGLFASFIPYGIKAPDRFSSWLSQLVGAASSESVISQEAGTIRDFNLLAGARQVANALGYSSSNVTEITQWISWDQLTIALGACLVTLLTLVKRNTDPREYVVSLFATTSLAIPGAFPHYLAFGIIGFAVLFGSYSPRGIDVRTDVVRSDILSGSFRLALSLTVVPLFVPIVSPRVETKAVAPIGHDLTQVGNAWPILVSTLWLAIVVKNILTGLAAGRRNGRRDRESNLKTLSRPVVPLTVMSLGALVIISGFLPQNDLRKSLTTTGSIERLALNTPIMNGTPLTLQFRPISFFAADSSIVIDLVDEGRSVGRIACTRAQIIFRKRSVTVRSLGGVWDYARTFPLDSTRTYSVTFSSRLIAFVDEETQALRTIALNMPDCFRAGKITIDSRQGSVWMRVGSQNRELSRSTALGAVTYLTGLLLYVQNRRPVDRKHLVKEDSLRM